MSDFEQAPFPTPVESSRLVASSGRQHLYLQSIAPTDAPWTRLLIIHGYGDHGGRFRHAMQWLAQRGVSCDAIDLRGHGRSTGRRGSIRRWTEYLDDLQAGLDCTAGPRFILGHSHGGLLVAAAAERGMLPAENTLGCILTAPWLAPAEPLTRGWRIFAEVANLLAPGLRVSNGLSSDMMSADPKMIADSASDSLLLRAATPRWYVSALRVQQEVFKDAAKFRLPLYCVMGDNDRIADRTAAERFVSQVGSVSRQFELIPGGRHEILRDSARWTTLSRILNWMTAQAAAEESVSPRRIRTNVD